MLHSRGKLRDTVLDWEDSLPTKELEAADYHSKYVYITCSLHVNNGVP